MRRAQKRHRPHKCRLQPAPPKTRCAPSRFVLGVAVVGSIAILPTFRAAAQTATPAPSAPPTSVDAALQEILVTASRRKTTIEAIPYNISAYSGDSLAATGTQTLAELAQEVPGFNLEDRGARELASSVPIIRGLNASDPNREGALSVVEQAPVATYLGNTPVPGYFPIDDVQRVEVLRGPQGTLYGAGSLGGTIRLIPNDPQLDKWSGSVSAAGAHTDHAANLDHTFSGVLNVPIGSIAALRIFAKYDNEPGYINQLGVMSTGPAPGAPLLATPGDVANSSAIYSDRRDVNFTNTTSGRVSLLVQPEDQLKIVFSNTIAQIHGDGGPQDNPMFHGGPSPVDPRITLPSSSDYSIVLPVLQPYDRNSDLDSIDASYDFGFATLSSTTSYFTTNSESRTDATWQILSSTSPYNVYYTGLPKNPRFIEPQEYEDQSRVFTQELRLISASGGKLDYVAGLYFEHDSDGTQWQFIEPGIMAQSIAAGGSIVVTTDANGNCFIETNSQTFEDKAVFGELTWHVTNRLELTGGARFFHQNFKVTQAFTSYVFGLSDGDGSSNSVTNHIFKANAAYEFVDNQRIYATFSQGFRRGGSNAFPIAGPEQESASILAYKPDKADNYEVGVKGRLSSGLSYTADVFDVQWHNPQIGLITPINLWAVAVNGNEARSRGVEFELHAPVFVPQLTAMLGYSYTDAVLTKNFCLPSGDGTGAADGFVPCGITGTAGQRLPGTPKHAAVATLQYEQALGARGKLLYLLNESYKSGIVQNLGAPVFVAPSYALTNASMTWVPDERWRFAAYSENLMNRRAEYSTPSHVQPLGPLADLYSVSRPRVVGLRVTYQW